MKETNRNRANVAKRKARQRKLRNRRIALTVCLMLVVMVASIGGTVAWLTAKTDPVTNTFTYGDINIALAETTGENYKIIPGVDIAKDPKVTVKANSEACWLFVKVEEQNWPELVEADGKTKKVSYSIAEGWKHLEGCVYYREVNAVKADTSFDVLDGNKVTVSGNLTKVDINGIITTPKLIFTAYAVQKDGIANVDLAWEKLGVSPSAAPTNP